MRKRRAEMALKGETPSKRQRMNSGEEEEDGEDDLDDNEGESGDLDGEYYQRNDHGSSRKFSIDSKPQITTTKEEQIMIKSIQEVKDREGDLIMSDNNNDDYENGNN